ncbi:MAG: site-specific DNA-methyltransferase [Phycisphaerae bacterium]|nr:site-specific DNA-methyltransferase [Phycisphaerae bacterium]
MDRVAERWKEGVFDMIFADPPYFLSNGGISCHAGRMVCVDKGDWDKSKGPEENHEFNRAWLDRCQRVLKPNGTIWVSGTAHVIHSVGFAMQQLGFKLLNDITWVKPNPPPNLSCRYFTHATETIIWAAKNRKSKHYFDYREMKLRAGNRQMKTVWPTRHDSPVDVWEEMPPSAAEKRHGKHPTQKPVALVERAILASTDTGGWVLDPFIGAGTTAVAALRTGRRVIGIDLEGGYVRQAVRRLVDEIDAPKQLTIGLNTSERHSIGRKIPK